MSRIAGLAVLAVLMALVAAFPARRPGPRPAEDPGRRRHRRLGRHRRPARHRRRRSTCCARAATPSTPRSRRPACSASPSRSRAASAAAASWSSTTPGTTRSTRSTRRETAPAGMHAGRVRRARRRRRPGLHRGARRRPQRRRARHRARLADRARSATARARSRAAASPASGSPARASRSTRPSAQQVTDNEAIFNDFPATARAVPDARAGPPSRSAPSRRTPTWRATYERIGRRPATASTSGAIGARHRPDRPAPAGGAGLRRPHPVHPGIMTAARPRGATDADAAQADADQLPRPRRLRHGPAVLGRLDRRRGAQHPRGLPAASRPRDDRRCTTTSRRPSSPSPTATQYVGDPAFVDVPLRGLLSDPFAAIAALPDHRHRAARPRSRPATRGSTTAAASNGARPRPERRRARPVDHAPDRRRPLGQRRRATRSRSSRPAAAAWSCRAAASCSTTS